MYYRVAEYTETAQADLVLLVGLRSELLMWMVIIFSLNQTTEIKTLKLS
jgi:hypothetical protein